jgi:hypothetical protein
LGTDDTRKDSVPEVAADRSRETSLAAATEVGQDGSRDVSTGDTMVPGPEARDVGSPDATRDLVADVADASWNDGVSEGQADSTGSDLGATLDAGEASVPMLKLVAGGLGGSGQQDGTGATAGFSFPQGLACDGAGNLFAADNNNHTIRRIAISTGVVTTLAGSPGTSGSADGTGSAARFNSPTAVAADNAGDLFVADSGNNTIRKIVVATGVVTTLSVANLWSPSALATDNAGNLFVADEGAGTIRQIVIATGVVATLAAGSFRVPSGLAADNAGNLFVADRGNGTIRQIVIATGVVTTLAGTPGVNAPGSSEGIGHADGTGPAAQFNYPTGLATDSEGNLFVADTYNEEIRKIVIATGVVTTLAGSVAVVGSADGAGSAAGFFRPQGVASDGAENLFVADTYNHTIRKIVVATGVVTTFAGSAATRGSTDGTGSTARFSNPAAIASDGAGSLFVADRDSHTIRMIDVVTGAVTTLAGSAGIHGTTDAAGTTAQFNSPAGVTSDGADNLFVADSANHTIRKVVIATRVVTTLAGSAGALGSADGTGTDARFNYPTAVTCDEAGNLLVADSGNYMIRKIVIATGLVTTLAGSAGGWGSSDGTGAAAMFTWVEGIVADGAGNLFVADAFNNTIRKIVIATGVVTTLAGSAGVSGSTDGTGHAARFQSLGGMTTDYAGNLFVADPTRNSTTAYDSGAVRKIDISTGSVTTVVGSPGRVGLALGPLPAQVASPRGLAFVPPGQLFITDVDANIVLVAQF